MIEKELRRGEEKSKANESNDYQSACSLLEEQIRKDASKQLDAAWDAYEKLAKLGCREK